MKTYALAACLVGALLVPCVARADEGKIAAEHFREGQRAFDAHDYARAASEFEVANQAKPAAAALLSAGLAWELASDAVKAATDLAAALAAGGLEARDEATARTHLVALDAKIGHLQVRGPASASVSVDGRDRGPLPLEVRVTPGDHTLEAQTNEGVKVRRLTTVSPGAAVAVDMTPQEEAPPPPPPPSVVPLQRSLGWIGLSVGAGAAVVGVVLGAVGLSARDEFVSGGNVDVSLHDEAVTMRTWSNVMWVTAGVFAVTGAVLVLTAPRSPTVRVGLGPSSATLQVPF